MTSCGKPLCDTNILGLDIFVRVKTYKTHNTYSYGCNFYQFLYSIITLFLYMISLLLPIDGNKHQFICYSLAVFTAQNVIFNILIGTCQVGT